MLRVSLLLTCLTLAPQLIECLEDCGLVKMQKSIYLVTGGGAVDSTPGKWPWLVPLFRKNNFTCGSSLINSRHLLSAAHCILERDPENFYALPGRFNISDESERNWVNRTILMAFVHAKFNDSAESYKSDSDIALFRMSQPVQYTDFIQPVCLPGAGFQSGKLQGTVVGYGYHNGQQHEQTPKQVLMDSIDFAQCFLKGRAYVNAVSGNSFCARGNNAAPCTGDSGGGYYVKDDKTHRYTTFGIVSQSISHCEANDYTVFVDVTKFIDWINQKITQDFEDPPFDICVTTPCGKNAKCSTFAGGIICACLKGFFGEPPNCKEYECENHLECETQQICASTGKCVNPCHANVCGRNAFCEPSNGHKYECQCLAGYESDDRDGCRLKISTTSEASTTTLRATTTTLKPTTTRQTTSKTTTTSKPDLCLTMKCGQNARCTNNGISASCSCLDNFIGSPPNCRLCTSDADCPTNRACVSQRCTNLCESQPCGGRVEECKMMGHERFCECRAGQRYSEALEVCELDADLIDGKVETERCCEWNDDWVIDRKLQTFVAKDDSKILANDFEVNPRFSNSKVEQIKIIACDGCRENIHHLPIKLRRVCPNLLSIYVRGTSIKRVRKVNLEGLSKVQWLDLDDNQIINVDADAFEDLRELRFMSLFRNKLQMLNTQVFASNLKLERLDLGENQLTSIPPQLIQHLTRLTVLKLFQNQLATVDSKLFANLSMLKELILGGNQLKTLPVGVFEKLVNLELIYLYQNQLTTLPADIFRHNKKLVKAVLFLNQISRIDSSVFDDNPSLKYVNLEYNVCVDKNYGFIFRSDPLTQAQRYELKSDLAANCTK